MARQNYSYEKRQKELAKKKKKEEKRQRKLDAKAGLSEDAIAENVTGGASSETKPLDQPSQT